MEQGMGGSQGTTSRTVHAGEIVERAWWKEFAFRRVEVVKDKYSGPSNAKPDGNARGQWQK